VSIYPQPFGALPFDCRGVLAQLLGIVQPASHHPAELVSAQSPPAAMVVSGE
jgi:hypothetical protein